MLNKHVMRYFLLFLPALALGACASAVDKSYQTVRFETPGAAGSKCSVYVDKVRYMVNTPGEVSISKSRKDMEVDCLAPGNRRQKVVVPPRIERSFYLNGATVFAGGLWDLTNGAMWEYPDIVQVNFLDVPVRDYDLPLHHAPELKDPSEQFIEEIRPGVPVMNEDRYRTTPPIKRRERASQMASSFGEAEAVPFGPELNPAPAEVDLSTIQPVSQSLFNDDFSRFNEAADDISVYSVE